MSKPDNPESNPESQPAGQPEAQPEPQADAQPQAGPREKLRRAPVARLGTASAIYTLAVIAALVFANAIGARVHKTLDLTKNQRYTLTASSLKVLQQVPGNITIYGFLQTGSTAGDQIQQLLNEYRAAGGNRVTVEIVDPAQQPALARRYGVTQYDDVVVVSGANHATATPADLYSYDQTGQPVFNGEEAVTNAILRAANPQHLTVYFLQGDGEHQTSTDYTAIDQALLSQGYTVTDLNLISKPAVPAGAAAVVVAGPTHDLAQPEVKALEDYAKAGGHLFVLLDPSAGAPLTNLYQMLDGFGVQVRNDVVVDPSRNFRGVTTTPVPAFQSHAITDPLIQGNEAVILPASLSIQPLAADKAYTVSVLLQSSAQAWGHTDLKSNQLTFNPATDVKGPLDMGVAVEATGTATSAFRAVVLGSSTFATDNVVGIQGNRDLFLNSVGWLTGRTQGIRVRPTASQQNQVLLTGNSMRGLFYGYVIVLPVLSLVGAAVVWSWRRRL